MQRDKSELRKQAEARLAALDEPLPEFSETDARELIHELRTHQIELEIQNEELRQSEQALIEARDHLSDLYDYSPVGYLTLSRKALILKANLTAARILGSERANLIGKPFSTFVSDSMAFGEYLHNALHTSEESMTEISLKTPDEARVVQLTGLSTDSAELDAKVVRLAITDISLYRMSQQALVRSLKILGIDEMGQKHVDLQKKIELRTEEQLESEIKFKTLFVNAPDPRWIIDENNMFILCNDAAAKMLGYESVEALQSTHPSELSPEFQPDGQSSLEKANEMMASARRNGIHRFEWEHRRSNGTCFPVEVTLSSIKIKGEDCIYCEWRDISERKVIEERLRKLNRKLELLSLQDALTDIANRRMFDTRLHLEWGRSLREKQPISLIMIDIDYFKQYNDTYGHLAGDECLIMVAKELSELSKRSMDLCARYGGEEFVLLLPNTNLI
ncbi:MAG TPA: diguanylate cyclase, partial [Mariprofundaceae bacterium]|nr:diguanylate cyclase [Mariprofundaceae bacterium]